MHWYYSNSGRQQGPVTEEEITRLILDAGISADTLVWNETLPSWIKLWESTLAPHLEKRYAPAPQLLPKPPPLPEVTAPKSEQIAPAEKIQPTIPPIPISSSAVTGSSWYYRENAESVGPVGEDEIGRLYQIQTATEKNAPDTNYPNSRKIIGVGELVDITFLPMSVSPKFSLSSSGNGTLTATNNIAILTAGDQAEGDSVTTTFAGIGVNTIFSVIPPSTIIGTKIGDISEMPNADGSLQSLTEPGGAGMEILLTVTPTNVSFINVGAGEEAGPASGVTGYFTKYPVGNHSPNDDGTTNSSYFLLDQNNQHAYDNAALVCDGLPYTNGTASWVIPTYWITVNAHSKNGPVHLLSSPVVETFTMGSTGYLTVSKYGTNAP